MPKKISFYSITSIYFNIFVASVMALVMDSAKDRGSYIRMFEHPFANIRIEPGFHYYTSLFDILGVPPFASIVLTCSLIYFLLSRVWHNLIKLNWLVSLLLFNFFAFGLMNYSLGTSIRMGLAIGLSLYASIKILQNNNFFWFFLLASCFIQYGAILYTLVFAWVYVSRSKNINFHYAVIFLASIVLLLTFDRVLSYLNLSNYYMMYFEDDFMVTERLFPFTVAFSILSIILIFNKISIWLKNYPTLTLLAIYSIPFLVSIVLVGNPLFSKMIIPLIFLQAIIVVLLYMKTIARYLDDSSLVFLLVNLNMVAVFYALKMYNFA